jgi:hypothetical protein
MQQDDVSFQLRATPNATADNLTLPALIGNSRPIRSGGQPARAKAGSIRSRIVCASVSTSGI